MLKPEGIIPAMLTPFTEQQEVNEQAIRRLVDRFVDLGVQGIFCMGTNGEFFALSFEEKIRIAEIVVDQAKGKVPIYVGAGGVTTREVIQLSQKMECIGVSALSIITPYFLPFKQSEIIDHYKRLADSTSLPIVMYNIPARTGISLEPNTVSELSQVPNIVGIKDSSGSFENILQYIEHVDSDFSVLAGTDSLIFWTLMAGGKGAVAATANVVPELVVSIYKCWKNGNFDEAKRCQNDLRLLRKVYQLGTIPSVFKEALNMMGFAVGPSRLPVSPLNDEAKQELGKVLQFYREQTVIE